MSADREQPSGQENLNGGQDSADLAGKEIANGKRATSGFEWKTRAGLFGIPLICVAFGTDEKGKQRIAKGFIAIGQFAIGGLAIAQFAVGLVGIGQFALGVAALGQLALSVLVGFGQVAVGTFAIGQLVVGKYARCQTGWAEFMWSPERTDMEAVAMFETVEWLVHQDAATIWENITDAIKLGL